MSDIFSMEGFDAVEDLLNELIRRTDEEAVLDAIEEGVKEFVKDLLRLPRPKSQISKSGYTHLVDSFAYKRNDKNIEVGWGKYYGPMVENGTVNMSARPHLKPLYDANKEKYKRIMINKIMN